MFRYIFKKLGLIFLPTADNKYYPKILESRFLYYYIILILFLKIITIPIFIYFPKSAFFANLVKTTLIQLTNNTRQFAGLPPLKENPLLSTAAYLKAKDMIEKDYFAHQSPEGILPWYWFKKVGYDYQWAGENLAIGFLDSEEVHQAWLNSPSHRKNILNPNFNEIGLAILKGEFQGNETTVIVQFFGTPLNLEKKSNEEELLTGKLAEKEINEKEIKLTENLVEESEKEGELINEEKKISEEKKMLSPTIFSFENTPFILRINKEKIIENFLSFITSHYHNLLQKIIYVSLGLMIISLFITIILDIFVYRPLTIQYKDLILKAISFSFLWALLILIDKQVIIQTIPHNLIIY